MGDLDEQLLPAGAGEAAAQGRLDQRPGGAGDVQPMLPAAGAIPHIGEKPSEHHRR
ncbi:hypothetical protein ACWF2L_06615 [Streptomyces anulatus]